MTNQEDDDEGSLDDSFTMELLTQPQPPPDISPWHNPPPLHDGNDNDNLHNYEDDENDNKDKKNNNNDHQPQPPPPPPPPKRMHMQRMRWMDSYGDGGYYTGEVDIATSIPDGKGFMEYDQGPIMKGIWNEGFPDLNGSSSGAENGNRPHALSTIQELSFRSSIGTTTNPFRKSVASSFYGGGNDSFRGIGGHGSFRGMVGVGGGGGGGGGDATSAVNNTAPTNERLIHAPNNPFRQSALGGLVGGGNGNGNGGELKNNAAATAPPRSSRDSNNGSTVDKSEINATTTTTATANNNNRGPINNTHNPYKSIFNYEMNNTTGNLAHNSEGGGHSSNGNTSDDRGNGGSDNGRGHHPNGLERSGHSGSGDGGVGSGRGDDDAFEGRQPQQQQDQEQKMQQQQLQQLQQEGREGQLATSKKPSFTKNSLLAMAQAPEPPEDFQEEQESATAGGGGEGGPSSKKSKSFIHRRISNGSASTTSRSSFASNPLGRMTYRRLLSTQSDLNDSFTKFREQSRKGIPTEEDEGIVNSKLLESEEELNKKKRRKKWCLLFLVFILFCMAGAGVVTWYMLVHLKNEEAVMTFENRNVSNQSETGPPGSVVDPDKKIVLPWDGDVPCAPFMIHVVTDKFGNDTSWELYHSESKEGMGMMGGTTTIWNDLTLTERGAVTTTPAFGEGEVYRNRLRHHRPHVPSVGAGIGRRTNANTGSLILRSGPYPYLNRSDPTYIDGVSGTYSSSICLPTGYYRFVIHDANGDGLCCEHGLGDYTLYFRGGEGREVHASTGQFAEEEVVVFEVTEEDVLMAGSESPSQIMVTSSASSPDDGGSRTGPPTQSPRFIPSGVQNVSTFSSRDLLMTTSDSSHGLLFDIQIHSTVSSLTIIGMDLLIEATYSVEYEIWTKRGSWQDVNETNPEYLSGFSLISNGTINGLGTSYLSTIPFEGFRDTRIEGGARQAFWVTLKESSLLVENYVGDIRSDDGVVITVASSPEFEVLYGSAVLRYPLERADPVSDFHRNKGFLGKIFFMENAEDSYDEKVEEAFSSSSSPTIIKQSSGPVSWEPTSRKPSTHPSVSFLPSVSLLPTTHPSVSLAPSASLVPSSNYTYPRIPTVIGNAPSQSPTALLGPSQSYPPSSELTPANISSNSSSLPSLVIPAQSLSIIPSNTNNTNIPISFVANTTTLQPTNIQPPETSTNTSNVTPPTLFVATDTGTTPTPQPSEMSTAPTFNGTQPTDALSSNGTSTSSPESSEVTLNGTQPTAAPSSNGTSTSSPESSEVIPLPNFATNTSDFTTPATLATNVTNGPLMSNSPSLPVLSSAPTPTSSSSLSFINSYNVDSVFSSPSGIVSSLPSISTSPSMTPTSVSNSPSGLVSFTPSLSTSPSTSPPAPSPTKSPTSSPTSPPYAFSPVLAYTNSILIEGIHSSSHFGYSSSISDDSLLLVVGAKDAWNELGEATGAVYFYSLDDFVYNGIAAPPRPFEIIYGQSAGDDFGIAVSLSSDGTRLVVGSRAANSNTGAMHLYKILGDTVTLTEVIPGQTPKGQAGWSVAISGDGNVIAMGATKGGSKGGGSVTTYHAPTWVPFGGAVEGLNGDATGFSVAFSSDGSLMAVGSPKTGWADSGKTSIYAIDGTEWALKDEIPGGGKSFQDGSSLGLSQDGSILVVGGIGWEFTVKGKPKEQAGHCKIYEWQGTQYKLLHTMEGTRKDEALGTSVAVSDAGNIIACGGIGGRWVVNAKKSGIVRLWNRSNSQEKFIWPDGELDEPTVDDASFGSALSLSSDGKLLFVGASTWRGSNKNSAGAMHIFDTKW